MRKLIVAALVVFAFSCRDDNRRSEREEDDYDNTEVLEPDTTASDTATIWDRDRDLNSDRMDNDESGAQSREEADTASTWDRHRDRNDSIQ